MRLGRYLAHTPYHDGTFLGWHGMLGAGAFNEVWRGAFLVGGKRIEVAVKFPSNTVSPTAAMLGISPARPDFALRNIAVSRVNRMLGWNSVPDTELCRLQGKTGIVMTLAFGRSPAAEGDTLPRPDAAPDAGNALASMWRLMRRLDAAGPGLPHRARRSLQKLGLRIALDQHGDPVACRAGNPPPKLRHPRGKAELVRLQVLDLLCAQADRHANNYLVDQNGRRRIVVQGVDNDQAFGPGITRLDQIVDQRWAHLAGLPQVVDTALYGAVMALGGEALVTGLRALLPPPEIRAMCSRLHDLQRHLIALRQAGRVIHPDDWDRVDAADLTPGYFARDYC